MKGYVGGCMDHALCVYVFLLPLCFGCSKGTLCYFLVLALDLDLVLVLVVTPRTHQQQQSALPFFCFFFVLLLLLQTDHQKQRLP